MKILFVVSGTKRVAATRYRVYQYLPYLSTAGVKYSVFSIVSDFITTLSIASPEFNTLKKLIYYTVLSIDRFLRFWVIFFKAPHYDLVFLQRVTFPFGMAKLLSLANKKIIFDIDDAIFLPDSTRQNWISKIKTFIREKEVNEVLRVSHSVVVENDYIKEYVSGFCDKIYKIPGPIDTKRYFVEEKHKSSQEIILGWIGSPATTSYLHIIDGVFDEIFSRFKNTKLVLIGAGDYGFLNDKVIRKPWDYETEVRELQNFHIGIMPMPDDKWTRGKLGCKMLQYMAVGIPSVVSYTPTNAELIIDNKNGFLVQTESEWVDKLSRLIEDKALRERIGEAGRKSVEELCSVEKNAPQLLKIFGEQISANGKSN